MSDETKGLRLYNTLTRSKEVFSPIDPDNVRMYVCGPTVYDFAHIGNARPVIVFDVLYRLLRHLYPGAGSALDGSRVTYVRNITDVDDKINARALRDFPDLPLNEAIRRVTETTAKRFHEDVAALGCLEPSFEPRATEFVLPGPDGGTNMVGLIQTLIDRGHAYAAATGSGDEILFDVASMPDYGRLSRRNLDEQQAGARVAVDQHKKNPADFVLWKQSSAEEPGWDATFRLPGRTVAIRGRPGWHIECSAMSEALLWDAVKDRLSPEALARPHQFDIHGGGLDLIFPHHENEIAQSRCAHGTPVMANYWMHNGFLQVEGRKMAKSEGNFVTIHELLHTDRFGGRKWPGEVLRLAMLMTHYREPIDFSVRKLEEAEATIKKYAQSLDLLVERGVISVDHNCRAYVLHPRFKTENDDAWLAPHLGLTIFDDLNTAALKMTLDHVARGVREGHFNEVDQDTFGDHVIFLAGLRLLGIFLHDQVVELDKIDLEQGIERRLAFIREKNWTEADKIRDELLAQGIQLMDYKDPESGERKTKWEVKR